jgi:large subunit ribosomal protein L22
MPKIKANLNYFRMSPRKVRTLANLVKGLPVNAAVKQLTFSSKRAASPLLKLLQSAVSNAKNNFRLEPQNLFIKEFRVDEGTALKRYMPRARGRATIIKKRTSRVSLVLDELKPKTKKSKSHKLKPLPRRQAGKS